MPSFSDFYFASNDGISKIHALRCDPDGEVRGIVQIEHGIADYIDRYRPFMEFLASHGFVAVGDDHLGHGKTASAPGSIGFFAERDGWKTVEYDMEKLRRIMSEQFPGLPYVLFGHSMGSFLTRTYIIDYPNNYDAVILCGTGHQNRAMILGGYLAAAAAVKLEGARTLGYKLNDIAFGSYCKGFKNPRTPFDWINRDEAEVDAYIADPLCGFVATNSLFRDMMGGVKYITDPKNIARINKDKPVYFMSGGADPVGENGVGVNRAYKAFCNAGIRDVFMRIYPEARHEILNELNKEDVFKDTLAWIESKLFN